MDAVKFGLFLKKLRKEKGFTQEQLAEHLNTTNKTVSRWETGVNLPDIDMLVILSDFYQIGIDELLDCERKSKESQKEETAVLLKLADYSTVKETNLMKHTFFVALSGVIALGLSFFLALKFFKSETQGDYILLFLIFGFLIYSICMCTCRTGQNPQRYLTTLASGFCAVIASNLSFLVIFFKTGNYQNHGIAGLYYALGTIIAVFFITGTLTKRFLFKTQKKN